VTQTAAATADSIPAKTRAVTEADFANLVQDNQAMVYSIAYNFLHDQAQAEELAQDVFLQLYRNLDRMESASHVTNWLRRVASHRSIDHARKFASVREVDLDSAPELSAKDAPQDPFLRDRLRRLVASLPENKRMLVILRYQEELEFEEIAKILRLPSRTVRTQLFRTISLLREKAARFLEPETPAGSQMEGEAS
jgi:RNA polymerase sigma-70 factor (ECF subfamily)